MGGTVHPTRQTADHRPSGRRQRRSVPTAQPDAVRRGLPRSNHGHSPIRCHRASDEEQVRSIGQFGKVIRKTSVSFQHDFETERRQLGSPVVGANAGRPAGLLRYLHPSVPDCPQNSPNPTVGGDEQAAAVRVHPGVRQTKQVVGLHHSPRNPSASAA